ncbi:hypothetical protein BDF20DRAFT_883885 [Mycotypha africana]|uniref:uncharacterized protein n=1 Tax=Mycotypha africana TaxID=64632 RepID=UPI002300C5C6|nr:uncharacterized protein BDF20DRAFT_883885 [Mycotypha africana]KAI8973744.1 hypothetical protein BDF20DRAFT_883885 [Mycotypha africana]
MSPSFNTFWSIPGVLLIIGAISSSQAHITLSPKFGEPGQDVTTAFHVPHGCNGSSTIGISVTLPQQNLGHIVPQTVTDWILTMTYTDSTNTTLKTVEWTGGVLKPTDALDFPIRFSVPQVDLSSQSNVTLYFPVHQTCEVGSTDWNATGGQKGEPAPTFVIVKNATQAAADAITIKKNSTTSISSSSSTASSSASSPTAATSFANTVNANGVSAVFASLVAAIVLSIAL